MVDSGSGLINDISHDWLSVKDDVFKEDKVGVRLIISVEWNYEHHKVSEFLIHD